MRNISLTEREHKSFSRLLDMILSTDSWLGAQFLDDTYGNLPIHMALIRNKVRQAERLSGAGA